ncbi:ras GTPase activating protein [Emericellopsis atlantica]|uniref:Ras GTPase activating protein n=1 Tax=Emericellopsis atlantica TaxID=2614577 RepID=A0A9P7ZQR1_9HYPO|nr:ras GTPase activating protein [Emericellopsis atlantica]KAG9256102.1 ras GTPase activating protein [Emericellopsis atlantica]
MSFRPPTLRSTKTDLYPIKDQNTEHTDQASSIYRFPSTASSSASSGYSHASSGNTSISSGHGSHSHKRGRSDVLARARTFEVGEMSAMLDEKKPEPQKLYSSARQSLRPLPQAPAASPTASSVSPSTPPRKQTVRHDRGKTIDMGKLSLYDGPSSPGSAERPRMMRPNSMLMTRSDTIRGAAPGPGHHHSHSATQFGRPELAQLSRSTTGQLRTLSRLAESDAADGFNISSSTQQVVGLNGRRRLQRTDKSNGARGTKSSGYGFEGRNWMDKQRQFLQAYEYLCHIGEAKEWIEDVIGKSIPPIVELEEALRDGVTLAEVIEALNPDRRFKIFHHPRLQYRHSDNIAIFFRYLDEVELPDLFRFELIDLYEKKNIPKVIYCIHALSWLLFRLNIVDFRIGNLVGQLDFEHHELEEMQKGLDKLGVNMPAFGNMGADFGVPEPEPEPEPEETEEERIDRELAEHEDAIVDFQAQIRGAMERLKLGETMQQLWDQEEALIDLQARIRGDFTRQVMGYRLEMRRFATKLQSAARGYLARSRQEQSEQVCAAMEPQILELQSIIRASKARCHVHDLKSSLEACKGPTRDIQAISRGFLLRKTHNAQQRATKKTSGDVQKLQAAVRGMLVRDRVEKELGSLDQQATSIIALQAAARAHRTRQRIDEQKQQLEAAAPQFIALQGLARGRAARAKAQDLRSELQQHVSDIGRLQATIRAAAVRRDIAVQDAALRQEEKAVEALQASIRGMLERQRIAEDEAQLQLATEEITKLQGHIRGSLYRDQHASLMEELHSHDGEFALFQAMLRGIMERGRVGDLLAELEEEEMSIIALQSAIKGTLVRRKFEEKKRYFNENMQKVIKIQSFVRAKVQGEAYKSLTTGKNPPVNAVKNFVHLLNDSDFDFNEEVEFERMRKTVVQQVRQNEMLEQYIDQLDIKIALLVKNKITLDEVVKHQHNYGGHSMGLLANSSMTSGNQFDLKALNKSSRKKLESYQQLFFNLQTQPQYLARLFHSIREKGTAEKDCKRIELLIMSLFGYAQKRREEYYLLKLLARSIREEVEGCRSIQDYLRGNFFWAKLLANYTRSPRDRKFLRDLLGPVIRDHIIEDPALDLESDPMQIYRSAINNEELRTGRPDPRPLDVPREVAIRDPETRRLFIDHLRDLREVSDQYFLALEDLLHKMPYGLRFLGSQMFAALCQKFKKEPQDALLHAVSNWIWKFYLQPALVSPEEVGVVEKGLSPLQKRNLSEVSKVIGQIASGRVFGGDNIYLQPLNNFVSESIERLTNITHDLISVPDAESTFDIDEFNDLYAKNKPTLYIKMTDVFAIHNLMAAEINQLCPSRDDILREILHDLGSAKSNESEMAAAGSSEIHMFLTPKLHDVNDPEAEVKSLFMETKRCVLYIIRVQTGANLLEILVKPISDEDEDKWQTLLHNDFAGIAKTKGAYSDANMVDVTRMSYYELKRTALENVMRLEHMGMISKKNFYQDVLNAIAVDIRSKSRRRVQRQRELEGVRMTLGNLHEKAKYLEQQRKSYDDYIESAMATLQNKRGRRRFLLPFTKQYNHQRELERSGRVPKFGSYKYSARALSEKGVLVSWAGAGDLDKTNMTISCDEVGVFNLEGSKGHIQMPGASALVPIEDLLQAQFEAHQFMNLFEGNLKLNVNLLLHLLYKKFYRTQ